jgi:hypothetical protein
MAKITTAKIEKGRRKKQRSFRYKLIKRLIICAAALALIMILSAAANSVDFSEAMTRTVSRFLLTILGWFSSIFPFSLFEVFLILLIAGGLFGIVWFFIFIKRRGKRNLLRLLEVTAAILCFILFYNLCVGFSYNRAPLNLNFGARYEMTDTHAMAAAEFFMEDFVNLANTLPRGERGEVLSPYGSYRELRAKLHKEFRRINTTGYLNAYTPRFKKPMLSFMMAELRIPGFYFGPLGEANIIKFALPYEVAAIAAHELAHAKGVMREWEAELIAAFLLISSDCDFLRYAGYMTYHFELLDPFYVLQSEFFWRMANKIPAVVNEEIRLSWEPYERFSNLSDLGRRLNEWYLRVFGQDGTGSYRDPGNVEEIPPDPNLPVEPGEPPPPPVFVYRYSFSERVLFSIFGGQH